MHLSRTTIYGLTTRSSDNFALIERHDGHVVTQLMMTLLWQLTFVVDGNSTRIPTALTAIGIDGSCKDKQELLNETFNTTSLVFKDGLCIQSLYTERAEPLVFSEAFAELA